MSVGNESWLNQKKQVQYIQLDNMMCTTYRGLKGRKQTGWTPT